MIQSTDLTVIEFKFVSATSTYFLNYLHTKYSSYLSQRRIKPSFILQSQLLKQEPI